MIVAESSEASLGTKGIRSLDRPENVILQGPDAYGFMIVYQSDLGSVRMVRRRSTFHDVPDPFDNGIGTNWHRSICNLWGQYFCVGEPGNNVASTA
ncbi:hypothetical protein BGZ81_010550 [Podila clonocystis]|nr:hypothetical protein BGZ81_010550 [Podila clonocystis]